MKEMKIEMKFAEYVVVRCPKCEECDHFEDMNSKMFDIFLVFHNQTCKATKFIVGQEVEVNALSNA